MGQVESSQSLDRQVFASPAAVSEILTKLRVNSADAADYVTMKSLTQGEDPGVQQAVVSQQQQQKSSSTAASQHDIPWKHERGELS